MVSWPHYQVITWSRRSMEPLSSLGYILLIGILLHQWHCLLSCFAISLTKEHDDSSGGFYDILTVNQVQVYKPKSVLPTYPGRVLWPQFSCMYTEVTFGYFWICWKLTFCLWPVVGIIPEEIMHSYFVTLGLILLCYAVIL